jgi:integrase
MTGTIVKRTVKDGSIRYDAVWRVGGKQKWRTFQRRKDAERFLTGAVKATHDGTYQAVSSELMAVVFDRWLTHSLDVRVKQGLLKPSTAKSYRSMLDTHLRPAFKDSRSDQFSAETVNDWVRARADEIAEGTLSPKFYNNLLNLLHVILAWARGRGQRYLAHDPLAEIQRLPKVRIERKFLEPAQISALLDAAQPPDDTILYLAAYSGLRRGELFGLQWSDLDEGTNPLRVKWSLYQGAITSPKTTHSERTVDLPARIVTRLQDYRTRYPALTGDYIFRTETGHPLDPDNWYKRSFTPTAVAAKLRPATVADDRDGEQLVGLHTLRHTYASLLINQGESIKYVSKQLGHASIQITADLYGHLFKETSTVAMSRLSMRIPVSTTAAKADVA